MNPIMIITGTPWYVWLLFGYCLFIGIKALRTHEIPAPLAFVIPIAFRIMENPYITGAATNTLTYFITTGITGMIIGFGVAKYMGVQRGAQRLSVRVPGNKHTLVIFISFFCIQYFFGVLRVINNPLFLELNPLAVATRGLFAGFLFGKALFYIHFQLSR